MEFIDIQTRDPMGTWRVYDTTINESQIIRARMHELKDRYPTFQVRAVDKDGKIVDFLG